MTNLSQLTTATNLQLLVKPPCFLCSMIYVFPRRANHRPRAHLRFPRALRSSFWYLGESETAWPFPEASGSSSKARVTNSIVHGASLQSADSFECLFYEGRKVGGVCVCVWNVFDSVSFPPLRLPLPHVWRPLAHDRAKRGSGRTWIKYPLIAAIGSFVPDSIKEFSRRHDMLALFVALLRVGPRIERNLMRKILIVEWERVLALFVFALEDGYQQWWNKDIFCISIV